MSSLSSAIHPREVVLQQGLSSAAPEIITLEPGPKISEKSADLSLKVGKNGSNSKPLENLFPANSASESPFPKQQINVYHVYQGLDRVCDKMEYLMIDKD